MIYLRGCFVELTGIFMRRDGLDNLSKRYRPRTSKNARIRRLTTSDSFEEDCEFERIYFQHPIPSIDQITASQCQHTKTMSHPRCIRQLILKSDQGAAIN